MSEEILVEEKPERLLRLNAVIERVGVSDTTIWRLVKKGEFPRPIKITKYAACWVESEVAAYIAQKIKQRDA